MTERKYKTIKLGPKKVDVPEEWKKRQLKDLADYLNGYSFKPSDWSEGGKPIIRIQNLTNSAGEEINHYDGNIEKRYIVKEGDLLVSWSATLGVFIWNGPEAVLNQHIFKVNSKEGVSRLFLYYLLKRNIDVLKRKIHGSTMKHITKGTFEDTFVAVPPFPEQKKMADILSTVDRAIQQTDEIIETSKELKKGLMQDLLTKGIGHEEFKEVQFGPKNVQIPTDWGHGYLRTLLEETQYGLNTSVNQQEGDYVLRVTDVASNGIIDFDSLQCSDLNEGEKEKYRLQEQDLVIARSGATSGKVSIYEGKPENLFFSSYMIKMRPGEELYGKYLFYILNSQFGQGQLMAGKQGSAQSNINTNSIERTGTPVPPLDEQREIAEKLSTVDEKIRQEEEYREKLGELKKGLMQDLLTGKVRLNT